MSDDDLVAHVLAREAASGEATALRKRRGSYPLSPEAPERYVFSNHVPAHSIGALLAAPGSWVRGEFAALRIEGVLPELVLTSHFPRKQLTVVATAFGRRFTITHRLHRDDTSLELPATTDRARFAAACAQLAHALRDTSETMLATESRDDVQWLTPLLDALVPVPSEDSVYTWLVAHARELFDVQLGELHAQLRDFEIDRSFARFGDVRATQLVERDGDAAEVAWGDRIPADVLLAPARHVAAVAAAIARYRARKLEEHVDELMFAGLDPGYARMLAEVAAFGERAPLPCVPAVTDVAVERSAKLLRKRDPSAFDHEALGVGEALHSLAFGDYRIHLCANPDLDSPHGAIVLEDVHREPPIVVRGADDMDPGFPADGSSRHLAAFMTWLERTLEASRLDADALAWLRTPSTHRQLIHDVHPSDPGEAPPWRFILSVPWIEIDEDMLASAEHAIAVYHAFLRDAIDARFAPGWNVRAEVAAARAVEVE